MGKSGPSTQTSTQQTQADPYVREAQESLLGRGRQMLDPWLSQTPQFGTAGFTPDQITAMNNAYTMANQQMSTPSLSPFTNGQLNPGLQTTAATAPIGNANAGGWPGVSSPPGTGGPGMPQVTNAPVGTGGMGNAPAGTGGTGNAPAGTGGVGNFQAPQTGGDGNYQAMPQPDQISGPAAQAQAQLVDPNSIGQFMNPYTQQVIDPAVRELRRQHGATSANIAAQSAAAGSFGGTREALRQAENDRALHDQIGGLTGNLLNQGYGTAAGLATQNANLGTTTSLQNAGSLNNMAQFNTGQTNAMNQFNVGQQNALSESNANRLLNSYNLSSQMDAAALQRQMLANSQLAQFGGQQQQQAQRNLDLPWQMLDRLRQITPGATGGTTTTTTPLQNPSGAQQALPWAALGLSALQSMGGAATTGGIGASLASIFPFAFMSDESDKRDIKKLGNDPDTGLPIYAYNYKDDPKNAPKRVGPMAQDIEKRAPEAVREIGGHKIVSHPWAMLDRPRGEGGSSGPSAPPRPAPRASARPAHGGGLPWAMSDLPSPRRKLPPRREEIPMDYVEPRLPWAVMK